MPMNEVTREWYGNKATTRQRAAYDEVLDRMKDREKTEAEAVKVMEEWINEQRALIARNKAAREQQEIEQFLMEQVIEATRILESESGQTTTVKPTPIAGWKQALKDARRSTRA